MCALPMVWVSFGDYSASFSPMIPRRRRADHPMQKDRGGYRRDGARCRHV